MAKDKSSFILYADLLSTVSKLSDKKAGMLFKIILEYVNDLNPDVTDTLLQVAFEPIKQQLKRDLKKWDRYIEKQSENGKLGGRPKAKETQKTQAFFEKAKKADNVNVSVNVNDNEEYLNIKFPIEHCLTVAMNDSRWSKKNKATPEILNGFNDYLEGQGIYDFNLNEYKKYFHHWLKKGKNGSAKNFGISQQPAVRKDEGATELTGMLKDKLASGLSS